MAHQHKSIRTPDPHASLDLWQRHARLPENAESVHIVHTRGTYVVSASAYAKLKSAYGQTTTNPGANYGFQAPLGDMAWTNAPGVRVTVSSLLPTYRTRSKSERRALRKTGDRRRVVKAFA